MTEKAKRKRNVNPIILIKAEALGALDNLLGVQQPTQMNEVVKIIKKEEIDGDLVAIKVLGRISSKVQKQLKLEVS
jgi:hypothetical protein